MENTNIQAFLDSLSEEQRTAVLACKTAEELDRVIDDYDIEIPDEMMADVAGGKGVAPFLLAGIMALTFTVGAAAPVYAASDSGISISSVYDGDTSGRFQKYGAYVGDRTEEKDKIDAYFDSLDYDEDTLFLSHMETDGTTKTSVVKNSDGTTYLVQKRRSTENLSPDSFGVANADVNVIYPGALLAADQNLVTGNPTPLIFKRSEIQIGIADANVRDSMNVTTTVNPTKSSGVYNGINEIKQRFKEDTDFAAQANTTIEKVESSEQIMAKMNFSQKLWGELKISAEADYQTKQQAVVVDIKQVFYTVNADLTTSADLFADGVTVEDVQKQISSETPAVMVSSVDYGKRIVACIQTDDMSFDLKAAVKASGLGGQVEGNAEAEYHSKLSKCKVNVFILGGSSEASGRFMTTNMDDLLKKASESTKYDGYVKPISYTTRYAKSGRIARTNYFGDTWETEATVARKATDITVSAHPDVLNKGYKKGIVKIYGRRIKSMDRNGRIEAGDEELIDTITLNYAGKIDAKIAGDVLLESVKVKVDYEGTNHKAFQNENSGFSYMPCSIDTSISNGTSTTEKINIRFSTFNGSIVESFGLTDKDGKTTGDIAYDSFGSKYQIPTLSYCAHVEDYGWMDTVTSTSDETPTAGITGLSLRTEGGKINLKNSDGTSAIQYRGYTQNHGWLNWQNSGGVAGITGESLRLEALEIKLTGEYAKMYDVVYRVHVQDMGWLDWVKNGETAGTTGQSKRIEGVEIKLVPIL